MYSRKIGDRTYTFEPSGGLLHASLVMQDRETDSYWSILRDEAIWGEAKGAGLEKLPGAEKATWDDWRRRHPDSLVLSVDGREHEPRDPYAEYFSSEQGFRGISTGDDRLADKALIYAFHRGGTAYAVAHGRLSGGAVFQLGERQLFLYRDAGDPIFRSTDGWLAPPGAAFVTSAEGLRAGAEGPLWEPARRAFDGPLGAGFERLAGFDTYWYSWSLSNPETVLLEPQGR